MQPLIPVDLGSAAPVMARLTTATGVLLANETVVLELDGGHVQRSRVETDQQGHA